MGRVSAVSPDQFASFGELLKFLRRRAGLTQRALSIAVGYSDTQISRQEHNQRIPDQATVAALYLPVLEIDDEPAWAKRLLDLTSGTTAPDQESSGSSPHSHALNNIPLPLTSFIGREQEIAELKQLLSTDNANTQSLNKRLVTITGPGGMGKTRLAIQVARELLAFYPDGVWRVDLASISDPELVPQTISSVLQLREQGSLSITSRLVEYFQDKKCLLLLDNCEHLVQACAQFADTSLQVCPDLVILATSRETLGIMGECVFRVSGLSVPDIHLTSPVDSLLKQESIQLFVDRAQNVMPGFRVTSENAAALAGICRQLEGMPLAIELAAARVMLLNVEQIAARLEYTFQLLRGSDRAAHPHQQTLLATIDWSYALLSDQERILLQRLSVFAGGWTLEAAEAIVSGVSVLPFGDILDLLYSLVNKSLVTTDRDSKTETRYRMLDTIRQYALQKLREAGELEAAHALHFEYMLKLIKRAEPDPSRGGYLAGWEDHLELEHDNLRSALEWSIKNDQIDAAMWIAVNLYDFWDDRGYFQEGRKWYEAGLQRRDRLPEDLLAQVLQCAGRFSARQGNLELAERFGRESVSILQGSGDKNKLANALRGLSATIFERGDVETAREIDLKMLELYREVENKAGIAMALAYIGWDEVYLGETQQGIRRIEESLAMQHEMGNKSGIAFSMMVLGTCLYQQAEINRADETLREALLLLFNDQKHKIFICNCLVSLAGVAAVRHQAERGAILMGISDRLLDLNSSPGGPHTEHFRAEISSLLHNQLDGDAYDRAFSLGRVMADGDLSEVVAYALESSSRPVGPAS